MNEKVAPLEVRTCRELADSLALTALDTFFRVNFMY